MDTARQQIIDSISGSIRNNNIILNKLLSRSVKTDQDISTIKEIETSTNNISTLIIKDLPANVTTLLDNTKLLLNNNLNNFSYTPYLKSENITDEAVSSSNSGNYVISKIPYKVVNSMVIGKSSTTFYIVDHVTNYNGESTLSISKSEQGLPGVSTGLLSEITDIDDEYTVSFEMRLNHFPSKIHQAKPNKYDSNPIVTKKYTSRRSDIISFNYDTENVNNKIEFGAMAPFAIESNNFQDIRLYENKFDDFSIATCLTYDDNRKLSLYTDYKFKLGETYNVKLSIRRITNQYIDDLSREINNTKEVGSNFVTFDGIKMPPEVAQKRNEELKSSKERLRILSEHRNNYFSNFTESKNEIDQKILSGTNVEYFNYSNKSYKYITDEDKQSVQDAITEIEKYNSNIDTFGNPAIYDIKLSINGIVENIATYEGKVWGDAAKKQKRKGLLATQPGFKPVIEPRMAKVRYSLNNQYIVNNFKLHITDLNINGSSLKKLLYASRCDKYPGGTKPKKVDFRLSNNIRKYYSRYNDIKYALRNIHSINKNIGFLENIFMMDNYWDSPKAVAEKIDMTKVESFKRRINLLNYTSSINFLQNYILNVDNIQNDYPIYETIPNLVKIQRQLNKLGLVTKIVDSNYIEPELKFTKSDYGSETDYINEGVAITRGSQQGIYNPLVEGGWDANVSPSGTTWNSKFTDVENHGWSNLENVTKRNFNTFYNALNGRIGQNIIDLELVMYDQTTNKYWKFKFIKWTSDGGGGFEYTRKLIVPKTEELPIIPGLYKIVLGSITKFNKKEFTEDEIVLFEETDKRRIEHYGLGITLTRDTDGILLGNTIIDSTKAGPALPGHVGSVYITDGNINWDEAFKSDFREIGYIPISNLELSSKEMTEKEFIISANRRYFKIKFTSWVDNKQRFSGYFQEIKLKAYQLERNITNKKKNKFSPNVFYTPIVYQNETYYIKYKDTDYGYLYKNYISNDDDAPDEYIPTNSSYTSFFKKLDVSKLRSIETAPYKINTVNKITAHEKFAKYIDWIEHNNNKHSLTKAYDKPFKINPIKINSNRTLYNLRNIVKKHNYKLNLPETLKNIKKFDKLYSKYTYKLNSSIDFGLVNTYYNKIENQVSLLNSKITISIGTETLSKVLQVESVSSEVKGSSLNPIVELSISPELPPGLTLSNTGNITGKTSVISKQSPYTITSKVYNNGYINTKKYYILVETRPITYYDILLTSIPDKRLKYYEVMLKYLGEISGLDSVGVNEVINQILEGGSYILKSNLTLEETNPISTRLDEFGIIYNIRQQKKGKV